MSSPFDIGSIITSVMPLVSLVLVMFIVTTLVKSLREAFTTA